MKNLILTSTLLLSLILSFTSCCIPCRKSAPTIKDLESATWTLIELNTNPIENSHISLKFDAADKVVYGTAPCNNFFSGYHLLTPKKGDRKNVQFTNTGATMRYCPDAKTEEEFTRILPSITHIKIEGDHMLMSNSGDSLMAVLIRVKM